MSSQFDFSCMAHRDSPSFDSNLNDLPWAAHPPTFEGWWWVRVKEYSPGFDGNEIPYYEDLGPIRFIKYQNKLRPVGMLPHFHTLKMGNWPRAWLSSPLTYK